MKDVGCQMYDEGILPIDEQTFVIVGMLSQLKKWQLQFTFNI